MVEKFDCWKSGERGKELKVPHHASGVVVCDGKLLHVKAACLM